MIKKDVINSKSCRARIIAIARKTFFDRKSKEVFIFGRS